MPRRIGNPLGKGFDTNAGPDSVVIELPSSAVLGLAKGSFAQFD